MNKEKTVDEALNTLKEIRGIINKAQGVVNPKIERRRLCVTLIIQISALIFGTYFLMGEINSGQITQEFIRSSTDSNFRIQGLVSLGSGLILLVAALYTLISFEAKDSDESLQSYLSKHFPALLTLNFFSDLLVKYSAVAAVVFALKPAFVAPLLLIFLADYLLQRRFFVLPFKLSLIAATALIGLAIAQFINNDPNLLAALSAFSTICATSALYIYSRLPSLEVQAGVSHE